MGFRHFICKNEELLAEGLIEKIDCGELWIFKGAVGSDDFSGFIDKLYYEHKDTYGTFCSCIFNDCLRIITAFSNDLPEESADELINLISKARSIHNSFTNIWYKPDNSFLDYLLLNKLEWKSKGHKTYELTYKTGSECPNYEIPSNIKIIPYEKIYFDRAIVMLDLALAHTFEKPSDHLYEKHKETYRKQWESGECFVMLLDNELVGMCIIKDAEIDVMAIDKSHQNKGLGKILLAYIRDYILINKNKEPYLYCIKSNNSALKFYLREKMTITGYSGYVCLDKII
ncbi:MAG: GNAT family N-acetyltransferase [Clostridia bacterium]|nr:GNAT family N-acetyltransferase [Clostridia bacterium]